MLRSAPCPIPRRGRGSPTFASICSSSARPPTPTRETLSRTSPQMAAPTTHTPTRRRRSTFSTWAPARCRARSRASPTFSRRRSSPSLRRRARLRRSSRSTRKTSSQTAGEPSSCCAPRGACRATHTTDTCYHHGTEPTLDSRLWRYGTRLLHGQPRDAARRRRRRTRGAARLLRRVLPRRPDGSLAARPAVARRAAAPGHRAVLAAAIAPRPAPS
mmetsp:Transcript_13706/g.40216  ORF Transcript_13706/g.40216 Transcript_13706/m.40216 type:complete len:216 (+) Transcript_13706:331-978(+)